MFNFGRGTGDGRNYTETLERDWINDITEAAEAEGKEITKGCVEGIFAKNLLEGLTGEPHKLEHWADSSSARAISQGLGT